MKSYTDLNQSKELSKILSTKSADMFYCYGMDIHTKKWDYDILLTIIDASNQIDIGDVPCWSLTALLSVIPKKIKDFNVLRIDINEKDFSIWYGSIRYNNIGMGINTKLPDITTECFVDACYEMILKLYELNLL